MINFYEILEVSQRASNEVIEKAYKVLAKKYHPDVQTTDNKKQAEEKMKQINEAYEILINPSKREEYNKELEKIKNQQQALRNKQNINQNEQTNNNQSNIEYKEEAAETKGENVNNNYDKYAKKEFKRQKRIRRKLERQTNKRYLEAYDDYLRQRGFRVRYRWTFRKAIELIISIILIIFIIYLLSLIPTIRAKFINIYMQNDIIKFITDIVITIFNSIYKMIINIFK